MGPVKGAGRAVVVLIVGESWRRCRGACHGGRAPAGGGPERGADRTCAGAGGLAARAHWSGAGSGARVAPEDERCGAGHLCKESRHRTRTRRSRDRPRCAVSVTCASGSTPLLSIRMCVTGRWYLCRLCQSLVVVCSSCDRGHAYCSRACSTEGRARNRRAARRRYAQTQRGRETDRARQRRYRLAMAERERGSAQAAVTASADGSGDDGGPVIDPATDAEEETVTDHSSGRPVRSHIRAFPTQSGRTAP